METFLHRGCPLCGNTSPKNEISSSRRAENLLFADLKPYWSGLFKEKVFFSYARCPDCGLLYCPDYFTPSQLAELYADMAPNMDVVPSATLCATQCNYWKSILPRLGKGDYFELGPDIGYIVRLAAQTDIFEHYWLFEPNRAVHQQLAEATAGWPYTISPAMDDFSAVPDASVSAAVLIHVLDHLFDPLATLRAIRRTMKPGGVLLIVTHNEKSLLRHAMSTRWPPFCLQHPEIYNPASIRQLVRTAGFSDVRIERSKNHFPIDFMVRQAGYAIGVNLGKLPLPTFSLGLKLGNIQTIAIA